MPIFSKVLALVIAVIFFRIFISLVRKRNVKPFYSFLWLIISLSMFSVLLFEGAYKWLATQMGLNDASFLIFFITIPFLLAYNLYLSIKISEISDRVQELISSQAILEKNQRESLVDEDTSEQKIVSLMK